MAKETLKIDEISIKYDDKEVLNTLSLAVSDNEILCLLGQSGSGKTTVLKAISGLLPLENGTISLGGQCISSVDKVLSPDKREIGIIFQDYALFPHLNVLRNICFGIKNSRGKQAEESAKKLLELVKMEGYENVYPHELSGGQQQRIAIARALAIQPKLLLLDEPFSNVDFHLRQQLMTDIRQIIKERDIPAIFVTHSKEEAFFFADKLAFMENGKIVQLDTAESLYFRPNTASLAESMGEGTWFDVIVDDPYTMRSSELGHVTSTETHGFEQGDSLRQFIRPEQLKIKADEQGSGLIVSKVFNGARWRYTIKIDHKVVMVEQSSNQALVIGMAVSIAIEPHVAIVFPI